MKTKIFEELQRRAIIYEQNEVCFNLNYVIAVDDGVYINCEVDHSSYCDECIDKRVTELKDLLAKHSSQYFHDNFDLSYDDIVIKDICGTVESSPESDSIERCEMCGKLIYTGVFHTFDSEHLYYLGLDSLNLNRLSDEDCYILHELISDLGSIETYPELVQKLKNKIADDTLSEAV